MAPVRTLGAFNARSSPGVAHHPLMCLCGHQVVHGQPGRLSPMRHAWSLRRSPTNDELVARVDVGAMRCWAGPAPTMSPAGGCTPLGLALCGPNGGTPQDALRLIAFTDLCVCCWGEGVAARVTGPGESAGTWLHSGLFGREVGIGPHWILFRALLSCLKLAFPAVSRPVSIAASRALTTEPGSGEVATPFFSRLASRCLA